MDRWGRACLNTKASLTEQGRQAAYHPNDTLAFRQGLYSKLPNIQGAPVWPCCWRGRGQGNIWVNYSPSPPKSRALALKPTEGFAAERLWHLKKTVPKRWAAALLPWGWDVGDTRLSIFTLSVPDTGEQW